jgi:AMP-activated protein kinase-like protein
VSRRGARRLLALTLACAAAGVDPCVAQVETRLDAAASIVKYDGFLSSGAASLTPSLSWRSAGATLAAHGTAIVFESGNTSVLGQLSAGAFAPPLGRLRLEGAAEVGGSAYARIARLAHALGRLRMHLVGGTSGAWAGPVAGAVWRGAGARAASGLEAGWWARTPAAAIELSWARVVVFDTAYSDVLARARWRGGRFDLEGSADWRSASHGGAPRLFGDLSATARLAPGVALLLATGDFPSDPVSGTIAGRFVSAGVRLERRPAARASLETPVRRDATSSEAPTAPWLEGVRVALEQDRGQAVLVLRAATGRRVEVMGDFTGWQPVPLEAAGEGRYRYTPALPAGLYHFDVRVDGGPWAVPQGADIAPDEFGGTVGVLVVP